MENNFIKIYWFDTTGMVWSGLGADHQNAIVCFETIELSDVDGEEGIHKIMQEYFPRNSKTKMLVRPFKIEFLKEK